MQIIMVLVLVGITAVYSFRKGEISGQLDLLEELEKRGVIKVAKQVFKE